MRGLWSVLLATSLALSPDLAHALDLVGRVGSTLVIPLGEDSDSSLGVEAPGFGGTANGPDVQRGSIVFSVRGGGLTAPVDLVTEATIVLPGSAKSAAFDDPTTARLSRGTVASIVRIPADPSLVPGRDYSLGARLVRGTSVSPIALDATLTLVAPRRALVREALSAWLPSRDDPRSVTGVDASLAIPRPAIQLEWTWSGGPELIGPPAKLRDGANKILGVELLVHYPRKLIDVAKVAAPQGRELAIWFQDDGAGELAIQAVSRDGMSVDHLEVLFDLLGTTPLDPADSIDGVRVELVKAIDAFGAPAEGGRPDPWSLAFFDVRVR